jgi:hypothetical protein
MAKSGAHAGPLASMVDRSVGQALGDYVAQTLGVAAAEVQKLYHDPLELLTRAVQPVLWLMLFGEVMARVRGVAPGNISYLDFLAAGILAQSALFVAIFYGISGSVISESCSAISSVPRRVRRLCSERPFRPAYGHCRRR